MSAVRVRELHPWRLSYREAVAVQAKLRERIRLTAVPKRGIRHVAGSDIAVSKRLDQLVAAVVVMSFPSLELVETQVAAARSPFPYIPGLLSFREIPVLTKALQRVRTPFELLLCDGQGIAHPRGLGLASHLGLLLDTPTIGCAKSRLVGQHDDPGIHSGDYARLNYQGRMVGSVLRTRDRVKPLYISPGHLADHASSRNMTLACLTKYRLPEPTRMAHIVAGEEKRSREARQR